MVALKRVRRMEVGPAATLDFESSTMRRQIQEDAQIEKGGGAAGRELAAKNPLDSRRA